MGIDTVVVVLAVIAVIVVLGVIGKTLAKRTGQPQADVSAPTPQGTDKQALREELQREQWLKQEEARKAEEAALETAHERKVISDVETKQAHAAFLERHDEMVAAVRRRAKEGCDDAFRQRFGVTRPPKAGAPEDDEEVQVFLREHYAALRDDSIIEITERLVQEETDRLLAERVSRVDPEPDEGESPETPPAEDDAPQQETTANGEAVEAPAEGSPDDVNDIEAGTSDVPDAPDGDDAGDVPSAVNAEGEGEPTGDESAAKPADDADTADNDIQSIRKDLEAEVREHFDADSVRTYLLAAISARFDLSGRPLGNLPWPAYTVFDQYGYGELALVKGAPTYAQDAYRAFAWKKFHTGKRAEKPVRGIYSWPETHELGDFDADRGVKTPAGLFSVFTSRGPLPLRGVSACAWAYHDLPDGESLLAPDEQHILLVNLEGLRKGAQIQLRFETEEPFLQDAEDTDYMLNAVGRADEAYIGISVSNPEAASPGEAPYVVDARDGYGFTLRMTSDARRHDDDTYPQFVQVNLAWCQPPSLKPEQIVRHVTR